MPDAIRPTIVTKSIPPGETLIWSAGADAAAARKAARASARWRSVFFWLFAPATAALSLACAFSVLRSGLWNSVPILIATAIFGVSTLVICVQSARDRELARSEGDILYALTGNSFLVILSDTGKVRRYGPSAFKRIHVARPGQRGGKGAIWFGWQTKDIGGKYTEVLHPSGDPAELAELLRRQFGAQVR